MFKLVLKYTKQFKWAAIIAPVLVALEVLFEVSIPRTMTVIIDEGINGAGGVNMDIIYQAGWKMVMYSFAAMLLGAASGILAAMASSGFIRNLRLALYEKIQNFSFANMDKFEVPSLVTRMTKDMRELRMAYLAIIRMLIRAPFQLITSTIMVFTLNAQLERSSW